MEGGAAGRFEHGDQVLPAERDNLSLVVSQQHVPVSPFRVPAVSAKDHNPGIGFLPELLELLDQRILLVNRRQGDPDRRRIVLPAPGISKARPERLGRVARAVFPVFLAPPEGLHDLNVHSQAPGRRLRRLRCRISRTRTFLFFCFLGQSRFPSGFGLAVPPLLIVRLRYEGRQRQRTAVSVEGHIS